MKRILPVLVGLILMSGCASKTKRPDRAVRSARAIEQLRELSERSQKLRHKMIKALRMANREDAGSARPERSYRFRRCPSGGPLGEPLTFTVTAPIEESAKQLADTIGFAVRVTNEDQRGANPAIVRIDQAETSACRILRMMGDQLGENTGLVVHPHQDLVEIIYRGGPVQ